MALDNLEAATNAAGLSLKDAVKVGVFLKNPSDVKAFDAIYAEYVSDPPPLARSPGRTSQASISK